MSFYSAVHYAEAYFFPEHYQRHQGRDSAIKRDAKIGGIWRFYARLKDTSEHARYEMEFFTANHYQLMLANLNAIKAVIMPLI